MTAATLTGLLGNEDRLRIVAAIALGASLRGRSVETLVGYDYAHAIVDDHSRLAFVELHDDEKPRP